MFNRKLKEENERLRWKIESLEDQMKELKQELQQALRVTRSHLLSVKRGEAVSEQAITEGLPFDRINGEQFAQLQKQHGDLVILDVRTPGEVAMGFIPGAKHVPVDQLSYRWRELGEDRRIPVVAYCASGARSEVACETLVKNGFERVFNLAGGVGAFSGKLEVPRQNASANTNVETDNPELFGKVQDLLVSEINPAVGHHGGSVTLVAVHQQKAYLRFGGGCQGCGMVDVTLRQGIVKRIQETVPQIAEVVDLTDHASGATPYFSSSAAH